MKIWCVVNSENPFQKLVGQCHQTWTCAVQLRRGTDILIKVLWATRPFVKLFLFVLYGCYSGVEYCPDIWRHYHYPYTFLPLDIVIQKYNQYTIVEPRIIGSPPFKGCMQHCGYWRLINDWYQICPPIDTIWQTCFSHWRVHQITIEQNIILILYANNHSRKYK